jgi:lipid II isoglutaminyl synthase (glutamine-hydrolysing)
MGLYGKIRCKTAKISGKFAKNLVKLGKGMGKSFPGYLFLNIGSNDCLMELAKQPRIGSIIITGTNGKTTTTKLVSLFLANDTSISYNYDSNTLNAIATGLLSDNFDLGVFEYGIRDIMHAIPDEVCKLVQPVGVVYTNISREHSLVAGVSNPFNSYLKAKELLCAPMKRGIVLCNADDPRTVYIGKRKEADIHVTYYGLEIDLNDESSDTEVYCPLCGEVLNYTIKYSNHRGIFKCSCGFERPKPDVMITEILKDFDEWTVKIEGNVFNYPTDKTFPLNLTITTPAFGLYNLYNLLCAVTTYASFTNKPENIENTVNKISKSLDLSILPPGRFEIIKIGDKLVGMGQGDNGDALKANVQFMEDYVEGELGFIYTTPDTGEDEIFEDHFQSVISANPKKVYVIPGRTSVKSAEEYYEKINDILDADFYPLPYEEMDKRRSKIIDLILNSSYKYIIVSGCGPEHYMWAELKSELKSHI